MADQPPSNAPPEPAVRASANAGARRFSRLEDDRLLQGAGRFLANLYLEGMLHAAIVRSNHAHARLTALRLDDARSMPGVVGVYTADDLLAAGFQPLPCTRPIKSIDGRPFQPPARHALAFEVVRYVG